MVIVQSPRFYLGKARFLEGGFDGSLRVYSLSCRSLSMGWMQEGGGASHWIPDVKKNDCIIEK